MKPYTFRFLATSAVWDISITITAEIVRMSSFEKKEACRMITDGLWGKIVEKSFTDDTFMFSEEERDYVCQGMKMIGEKIVSKSPYKEDSLVVFHEILFNDCFYQPNALAPAVITWFSKALDFESPCISTTFNKNSNQFEFDY